MIKRQHFSIKSLKSLFPKVLAASLFLFYPACSLQAAQEIPVSGASLEDAWSASETEAPEDSLGAEVEVAEDTQNYKIGVGDLIRVEVYDETDLTKEVRVLTDGKVSLPLLGAMKALGKTVTQFEDEITKRLAAKYLVNPQVTIFVKEFSRIYIFGEVKKPGSFPLYGRMTVFEVVTLAGGFTEVANGSKVKVIRQRGSSEVSYEVDVEKITKHGDTSADLELEANDRVIVPRGFF